MNLPAVHHLKAAAGEGPEQQRVPAAAGPRWDPNCIVSGLGHLCRDRDGDLLDSRGRSCWASARSQILRRTWE